MSTSLLLFGLVSLELDPQPIHGLVREDRPQEDLRNRSSETLVETHLLRSDNILDSVRRLSWVE